MSYCLKWLPSERGVDSGVLSANAKSIALKEKTKLLCIKLAQMDDEEDLAHSVSLGDGEKFQGRYKRLAPFQDDQKIWRVGLRLREYTPFTLDHKPPAFLPRNSRYTRLLMEESHAKKHSGVDETVAQFRMNGFWTVQAAKLAKVIRSK